MKFLFTLIASTIAMNVFAQYALYESFEYPYDAFRSSFYVDTVNCNNNLWQIGRPQKTVFDTAYSAPNVIITDTLNTYPANDTSILYVRTGGLFHGMLSLRFQYQLDIDTLSSAKFEVSGDLGANWINPMTEDTTYLFYWTGGKPSLDTSTHGWHLFDLNMDIWSYAFAGSAYSFPHYRTSDTILYRFTFISGDSTVHRDGWMMDNFMGENTGRVGVDAISETSSHPFPNPSCGTVYLHPGFKISDQDLITVYNMEGQQIYSTRRGVGPSVNLPLPNGVYMLRYMGSFGVATDRITIIK
jgi:hypothetical protein